MQAIKIAACIAMSISNTCFAATDPECLKHLGGAFGDVECFNGLSAELTKENVKLGSDVASTIPNGNRNRSLLKAYLRNQVQSRNYCELSRNAITNWRREAVPVHPRYHDYDVAYYECVYMLLVQENRFLKNLYKGIHQE
jgi:hypothetical protein